MQQFRLEAIIAFKVKNNQKTYIYEEWHHLQNSKVTFYMIQVLYMYIIGPDAIYQNIYLL